MPAAAACVLHRTAAAGREGGGAAVVAVGAGKPVLARRQPGPCASAGRAAALRCLHSTFCLPPRLRLTCPGAAGSSCCPYSRLVSDVELYLKTPYNDSAPFLLQG